MKVLYPTEAAYTEQLRALEEFVKANPKAGYGHFLLAYQYLVLGQKDSAVSELETGDQGAAGGQAVGRASRR